MCVIAGGLAIGGAVSAAGSLIGSSQQAGAAENATNAQEGMFNTQVGNLAPFREGGQEALTSLDSLLGVAGNPKAAGFGSLNAPFTIQDFHNLSPAYKFQLQQGQQGVLNQNAASEGALSGASLKDLLSFNQNYANTAFNNAFNQYQTQNQNVFGRLSSIANLGEAAASNQATGGSNYAQGIGQSLTNIGSAQGAGTVGAANSLSGLGYIPWLMQGGGAGWGGGAMAGFAGAGNYDPSVNAAIAGGVS